MNGTLVLTTKYSIPQWFKLFIDKTIADTIIDRIVHSSHDVLLKGSSMRRAKAKAK